MGLKFIWNIGAISVHYFEPVVFFLEKKVQFQLYIGLSPSVNGGVTPQVLEMI